MRVGPRNDYTASKHKGRLNARVMETVGNAFYGGLECAGNGNSVQTTRYGSGG